MKTKFRNVFKTILTFVMIFGLSAFVLASCDQGKNDNPVDNPGDKKDETVAVSEVTIELSSANAKVGETVTATVKVRPSNATDQSYALSSSDETVATIAADKVTINCVKSGTVIITARSKSDPTKKAEATLVVLGADEHGRYENLFEAEEANLVPAEGSGMRIETVVDDRLSGTGVVGSLSKGDRLVWGIEATEADDDAVLEMSLMGPSGWLGMWDSIPYNFADWYTIKVNGTIVDTEDIQVEGTLLRGGSADYYAVKNVTIGHISLNQGLNVITFVVSNRYDQSDIHDDTYNGILSCWGNVDSMSIFSSKTLTYVPNTSEVDNADADVIYQNLKLEVEASETRVYKDAENPKVDLGSNAYVEFESGMNILFGLNVESDMRVKLVLNVAAPFVDELTTMTDIELSQLIGMNINGKDINISGLIVKGNNENGTKENFTQIETGWINLEAGENTLGILVKNNSSFEYLGGLDFVNVEFFDGSLAAFLGEEPQIMTAVRLEAEADTTRLVGCNPVIEGDTYVEFIAPTKVQSDLYVNKLETSKIIFGVTSNIDTFATLTMRVAAPYIDATTTMEDVSLGSLGDLWVNGVMVSTPNIISGNNVAGVKDNFSILEIGVQIELSAGNNRISWEPRNYTANDYEYLGGLDYLEILSPATITPYRVHFWTDRHTYFDDGNNEPIWVTCAEVSETTPNSTWIAVYRIDDSIYENSVGSLYWYYPIDNPWNTIPVGELGTAVDITTQNPNSERPLINAETGGFYLIVYYETDSKDPATNAYTVVDMVKIGVWDDVDGGYGGLVDNAE